MDKLVNAILLIISLIPTFKLLLSPVGADLYVQPCVDSKSLHRSGLPESRERRLLFGTNAASPVSLALVLERDFSLSRMLVTFCERLNFFLKKRVRSVVLVFLKTRGDLKKNVCWRRLRCFVSYHGWWNAITVKRFNCYWENDCPVFFCCQRYCIKSCDLWLATCKIHWRETNIAFIPCSPDVSGNNKAHILMSSKSNWMQKQGLFCASSQPSESGFIHSGQVTTLFGHFHTRSFLYGQTLCLLMDFSDRHEPGQSSEVGDE